MRFVDIYSDIEEIINIKNERALVKRVVQRALDKVSGFTKWPFYMDIGYFTTVAPIETGDADVTAGSRSVTSDNVSTSWAANVVNRKFRSGSQQAYYNILTRVSSTALTLEAPYQGSTAANGAYSIYQDEYLLNADVSMNHVARQIQTGRSLTELDALDLDSLYPTPTTEGDPSYLIPIGRSRQGSVYSTGTVTATASGTTITGTSTSWLGEGAQGVSRGSRIRIANDVYTIKSVDSDTQVTIYGTITNAASGATYEIFLDNIVAQIYPIPDAARNVYYRYWRKPAQLSNDWDEPDMPSNWQWLLIPGALVEMSLNKGDEERARGAENEFLRGLQRMKAELVPSVRVYHKKSQTVGLTRRGPRWPDAFDVRARAF